MARNVRQSNYYSFIPRHFLNRLYRSIWCRDFTIICITKKLEVKMSVYTSFISDVHKSYRAEKLVLIYLIFLPIKISKCLFVPNAILFHINWLQTQFYSTFYNVKINIKAQHMTFIQDITIQNKLNKIY